MRFATLRRRNVSSSEKFNYEEMIMFKRATVMVLVASFGAAPIVGCESLPGNKKEQGAVIGGVGGAAAGPAIAKNNRLAGGLIGGLLGAGGGYLIGANMDKHGNNDPAT